MHSATKLSALALVASLLTACGGGTGASIPAAPASDNAGGSGHGGKLLYVPRTIVNPDGSLAVMFYTKVIETGGGVGDELYTGTAPSTGTALLTYHGGPIQTAPKIYVVSWGSAWNSSGDPDGEKAYYTKFISGVGGSAWMNTVTQYTQSGGAQVGNASGSFAGSWTDTTTVPNLNRSNYATYLGKEAARAAAHFGDYSSNASYVILLAHGVKVYQFAGNSASPNAYCAWHSSTTVSGHTISYTNLPYIADAGYSCGSGSVNSPGTLDGVSIVGGHEQAETETDPQPDSGWLDSSGAEIGDKCAWTDLQNNSFSTGTFPTQPLWSNAASGCVQ